MKIKVTLILFFSSIFSLLGQNSLKLFHPITTAVFIDYQDKDTTRFGSGVLIRNSNNNIFLITALHVLGKPFEVPGLVRKQRIGLKSDNINVTLSDDQLTSTIEFNIKALQDANRIHIIPEHDIVAVHIGHLDTKNETWFLPEGETTLIAGSAQVTMVTNDENHLLRFSDLIIGGDVFVYGYPKTLGLPADYNQPLVRKGVLAGVYKQSKEVIIDCRTYGGNSGGPVFQVVNNELRLIGIIHGAMLDTKTNAGSDYSVIIPVELIYDKIREL